MPSNEFEKSIEFVVFKKHHEKRFDIKYTIIEIPIIQVGYSRNSHKGNPKLIFQ